MSSIFPHIFRLHNPVFSNSLIVLHMFQNAPVFCHFDLNIFHWFTLSSHMFPIFSHEFSWFSKRVTRYEGREGELIDLNDEIEKSPPSYSYSGVPWPHIMTLVGPAGRKNLRNWMDQPLKIRI